MNVLFLLILLHFLGDTVRSSALFNRYDAALTSVVTVTVTAPAQPAQTATDTSRGTTTTSSSSSYTDPAQLQYDALSLTNTVRQQHNASALMWNKTLAIYALNWADRCLWKHSVRFLMLSFFFFLFSFFPFFFSKNKTKRKRKKEKERGPLRKISVYLMCNTGRPQRRKPSGRLHQHHLCHRRVGARKQGLRLLQTYRIQRIDGPFHAAGMEGDKPAGVCGSGLFTE